MPTVISQLDAAFRAAIRAAFDLDADPLLTVSQNERFGDYQSNVAMSLAKQVTEKTGQKTNPRQVAEQIKSKLDLGAIASEISIAGPGFINVRLDPKWLAEQARSIARDERLGIPLASSRQKVVVDYSGPNIAKEMHVGHLRSTIIGYALARVVEFKGDEVVLQNHIGDWGTQFGMLIAYLDEHTRHHVNAKNPPPDETFVAMEFADLEGFYRRAKKRFDEDGAFQDTSRATVVRLQSGEGPERAFWQQIVEETRRHYQPLYQRLNVLLRPEHERGESFYNQYLAEVVRELKEKNIAVESEGATVVFVPGFENPLIIQKSDGGYLYGTTDLAAIRYRVRELHADRIIYTHDSRQAQHFSQVFWTARQASWTRGEEVTLQYAPFGTMLGTDGKPFKSRSGEVIKLKDLLDEAHDRAFKLVTEKNPELPEDQRQKIAEAVGIGAMKYFDLSKDRTSDYAFSFDAMLSLEGNTAPYLQYAYARIKAIFRKASAVASAEQIELTSPYEIALLKHVLRMNEILDLVARELKPHHLTNYLYELAGKFSSFYENCPVIQSAEPVRSSRLLLCDVTARTLAQGLELLGIEHPEQM
ncbi:MAG: arginyl-tRNA synthetase [Phycisphaerales bacterium]|nr:arginyl-tRNA synthetase [Phycisphaerales bacterium]